MPLVKSDITNKNADEMVQFSLQVEAAMATNANFTGGSVTTNAVNANITTYNTGNLNRGTRYFFRVRAFNNAGNSAWVVAPSSVRIP